MDRCANDNIFFGGFLKFLDKLYGKNKSDIIRVYFSSVIKTHMLLYIRLIPYRKNQINFILDYPL